MTNCIDEAENKNGVSATLVYHLFVECPHCNGQIDMFDLPGDEGEWVSIAYLGNNWKDLTGEEFTCCYCGEKFTISSVEA